MKRRSFKISISRQYTIGKKINSHLIENDGKPSNISACVLLVFYCNFLICNSFFFKYIFKTALSGDFIPINKDFSLLTICELIGSRTKIIIHACSCSKDGWYYPPDKSLFSGSVLGKLIQ